MDISSALVAIKTALELNNLLQSSKIDAEAKKKSAELTNIIISLQETISLAHAKNHEITEINNKLRNQIMKMSNWQKEAKRYELHELSPGVLVFKLKKDHHNSEPLHYLCPNCHQDERKSILQKKTESFCNDVYECKNPACKAVFDTGKKDRKITHGSNRLY